MSRNSQHRSNRSQQHQKAEQVSPEQNGTYQGEGGLLSSPLSLTQRIRVQWIVCFFFGFLLYAQTITYKYALDDAIVILSNQFTRKGTKGVKDILTKDTFHGFFGEKKQLLSGGRYRPLTLVMFAIEWQLFGDNPAIFHFINSLLYGLLGIVLFYFLRRLLRKYADSGPWFSLPFLITLLFLAHPLHTEAVANIKGRDEILSFLFCILAADFSFRYFEERKVWQLPVSCIFIFLGLMAKENAITFIAVVPLCLWFFRDAKIKDFVIVLVPLILGSVFYLVLRQTYAGSSAATEVKEILNNPFAYMTVSQRYATIMYTTGKYLQLMIWPHPLTHDYYFNHIPTKNWSDVTVVLSILANLALLVFAILGIRKKSIYSFGILYYFATFSVVSNVFFPVGTTMSERFLFYSSLGFAMSLGYFIYWLVTTGKLNLQVAMTLSGLLLLGYSARTVARNPAWYDNMSLFQTDIITSPNSAKLNNSLGGQLVELSDLEKDSLTRRQMLVQGMDYLHHATEIHPSYSIAWLLQGNGFFRLDRQYNKALDAYRKAIQYGIGNSDAWFNIAVTEEALGNWRGAIIAYANLVQYKPNDPNIYEKVGEKYLKLGKPDSALIYYNSVVSLDPNHKNIYREIGTIYGQYKGDLPNAIKYLTMAVERDSTDLTTLENLGIANAMNRNYLQALKYLTIANKKNPQNMNVVRNMANLYYQMGNMAKANEMNIILQQQQNSGR